MVRSPAWAAFKTALAEIPVLRYKCLEMFCPVCKAEYRTGFTHCSDCDVDLVETLGGAPNHALPQENESGALLWTGTDSSAEGIVCRALDDAGISYHRRGHNVGALPGLSRPVFAILVHRYDLDGAKAVLENMRHVLDSGARAGQQAGRERAEAAATLTQPAAEANQTNEDEEPEAEQDYVAEDFDPELATAEVWSGPQEEVAQMLEACLGENGIGCLVDDSGPNTQIRVMPDSEARAREIIREVVEGAPPE